MAIVYTCDGCNEARESRGLVPRGITDALVYCEKCLPVIDDFMEDRDKLHDEVQKQWEKGIKRLKTKYRKNLKRLPDELED